MTRRGTDHSTSSALTTLGILFVVGLIVSLVSVVPADSEEESASSRRDLGGGGGFYLEDESAEGETDPVSGANRRVTGQGGSGTGASEAGVAGGPAGADVNGQDQGGPGGGAAGNYECAPGRNGGSTDTGVSDDSIKLGATVVDDGPGSSFLGPVRISMTTVVNKVNRAGGICGRRLDLLLRNDSWEAQRGKQYIQNFVESEKVFALAVVPSSEGLRAADGYIADQGVPVVGSDGMLGHQYTNPWIWPVATPTISTMHIMAQNAAERGSTAFGIVFDAKYRFGVEGAFAFNQAVQRLTGNSIPGFDPSLKSCKERFCGVQPGKPSYASEAQIFNTSCYNTAPRCDFVGFLLEPDTAVSWFANGKGGDPKVGMGGAQPLFTRSFAEECQKPCDGMWVWSGYIPPIEDLASQPEVAAFVNDIRAESGSADVTNQFLEGGYVGMNLLVKALQEVGPNLTRAGLRATLDQMTYDPGLSSPLAWREGAHFANTSAHAFEIQFKSSFNGWRRKTDFIADPWVGQDIPSSEQ